MNAIIFSALLGVCMMMCSIVVKQKNNFQYIAIVGLIILLLVNVLDTYGIWTIYVNTHEMLKFEKFGLYFNSLAIFCTLVYVFISGRQMLKVGNDVAEYYALIFFILCGVFILSSYSSLLMLFLGIEIMTIPLYILTGSDKRNLKSNEASLKYFLMGAFSTGIMLMGIALWYGFNGTFNIYTFVNFAGAPLLAGITLQLGLLFIFVAMLFKVSAAPFHFWTPDVYDGAPTVFTSFMATIVKAAGFIAFIKLFEARNGQLGVSWNILLAVVIFSTLFIGNITAVFQQSVKRMLAYSSIAQAGFMLFALYGMNEYAKEGLLLYSVAYSLATIGIFAILMKMKDHSFDGYNGLAKTHPLLAATNTIFLFSLAGIPLTAGFFAKYYMLSAAIKVGGGLALFLVISALVFAAVSVYYYFRIVQAMYFKTGDAEVEETNSSFNFGLILISAILIVLGILPQLLFGWLYF